MRRVEREQRVLAGQVIEVLDGGRVVDGLKEASGCVAIAGILGEGVGNQQLAARTQPLFELHLQRVVCARESLC